MTALWSMVILQAVPPPLRHDRPRRTQTEAPIRSASRPTLTPRRSGGRGNDWRFGGLGSRTRARLRGLWRQSIASSRLVESTFRGRSGRSHRTEQIVGPDFMGVAAVTTPTANGRGPVKRPHERSQISENRTVSPFVIMFSSCKKRGGFTPLVVTLEQWGSRDAPIHQRVGLWSRVL